MTAMAVRRMTLATWYKHRFSMVGIPAVFLLPALALFADGFVQRHYLSVHHLNGCLVANATTGGSSCVRSFSSTPPGNYLISASYPKPGGNRKEHV